ncbi:MipA/OmpV family protein [Sphingomonas sp. MMS12-HWE2-04]|uniref:MipA/OmpV family protein n=1 Tax=Sphingomonas sp. MMS12-HWE2-04 TaxID=3234199 RepID=UPI00384DF80E
MIRTLGTPLLAVACLLLAPHAFAQSDSAAVDSSASADQGESKPPRRYRVALGPQLTPRFPGSDDVRVTPLFDLSMTRGDEPFRFEAADESFGIPLIHLGGLKIGPAANFEGSRRRKETGLAVDEVGTTVELGGMAEFWLGRGLRVHGEVRQGVNGHGGLISNLGFDYVARHGDKWLVSLGPRVALSDSKFQDAYFGVNAAAAARTGLATYDPDGGVHAVGASATALYQFTPRWGVYAYAKYDRLIGDAADSPIIRTIGSRNQLSGGGALTFTFGKGVR